MTPETKAEIIAHIELAKNAIGHAIDKADSTYDGPLDPETDDRLECEGIEFTSDLESAFGSLSNAIADLDSQ